MDYTNKSENEILAWLKANLNEERYIHSLSTAECAKELAIKYNIDVNKAYLAGLLHDAAKCISNDKQLELVDSEYNLEEEERLNKKTVHAPASAVIAKREFGVIDNEILSAIRWHTLGKLDMSALEKIIFLADKIEPKTRTEDYSQDIRDIITKENNIDKAILECYKNTIISLVKRNLKICLLTVKIYNQLESKISS